METLVKTLSIARSTLTAMEEDPAAYWEDETHEVYDQMLDECCTCETCGRGGSDLKESDPIAYRCGFADYFDGDTARDFARSQEDYKELAELADELEEAMQEANEKDEELTERLADFGVEL